MSCSGPSFAPLGPPRSAAEWDCRCGGEVVLGGVQEYQDLHADVTRQPPWCDKQQRPPLTVVNFAVHDIAEDHGSTRIWPVHGRPRATDRPMQREPEPREILRSTLAPMRKGSCVVIMI